MNYTSNDNYRHTQTQNNYNYPRTPSHTTHHNSQIDYNYHHDTQTSGDVQLRTNNNLRNREYNTSNKENGVNCIKQKSITPTQSYQVAKLMDQNATLRAEIQQIKQNHEQELSKYRRNIKMKDQLLDQCEKQITNLRINYEKLRQQSDKNNCQEGNNCQQSSNNNRYKSNTTKQQPKPQKIQEHIPLSIIPKGVLTARIGVEQCSNRGAKMSHGLIRKINS